MQRKLPVQFKFLIPIEYHKAKFGALTTMFNSQGEAAHMLGDNIARKNYRRGGYALIEKDTKIEHKAGFTCVTLYYSVFNQDGLLQWPIVQ